GHFEVLCPKIFGSTPSAQPACCRSANGNCCSQTHDTSSDFGVKSEEGCKCRFLASSIPLKSSPVAKPLSVFASSPVGAVAASPVVWPTTVFRPSTGDIEFGPPPDLVVV